MNNGMISVKDREVMEKRYAFQKTIELHKKIQELQPNAIFRSKIERDCSPSKEMIKTGSVEFDQSAYQTGATMRTTMQNAKSTFNTIHERSSIGLFNESRVGPVDSNPSSRVG